MGALSCRSVARGCALALSVAVTDRPLLRRSRLEAHRRGGPAGGERGQQFLRRERADEGAAARRQGPLLRPLDRSEESLWTRVWARQPAIPYALPGERRGPHPAAGKCPSSRPRHQPTKYSPESSNACTPTPWEAVERTFINALTTGGALETATTTR